MRMESCGRVSILHAAQHRKDGEEHGDEAGHAADDVGDRLRDEDAVGPHAEEVRQGKGERHDEDNLPEQ